MTEADLVRMVNLPDYVDYHRKPGRTGFYRPNSDFLTFVLVYVDFERKVIYDDSLNGRFKPRKLEPRNLMGYTRVTDKEVREHFKEITDEINFLKKMFRKR